MQVQKKTGIWLDDAERKALEVMVVAFYNRNSSGDYPAEFRLANDLIDEVFG